MNLIDKFILGLLLLALAWAVAPKADAQEQHWVGVNTVSRHFTADNEKYCEKNWGAFYEYRWRPGAGVQVGYYRNSWCKLENENRIDDTFYALYVNQPWAFGARDQFRVGGFGGLASGYSKGRLTFIGGAMLTWEWDRAAAQAIVNPAVMGQQFKWRVQ